ncbi:MAG TPA: ribonuclease H-like YkuK family protein [Bacillales bacterium]|nr:ribonuclease H-like YkuK family protein [Bacillales bacterium]
MKVISPTCGELSVEMLRKEIRRYIEEDREADYRIIIGTDSKTNRKTTMFVTALILCRIGKGARFFFHRSRESPIYHLSERIYKETELSLEWMEELKNHGIMQMLAAWPIEIHLDIGKHGDTRKLIQEIVGWITSVGCVARIKPDAFGASAVADKYTKT